MKLVSFRVSMYKSVIDSGEIRVSALTVIVGKNESGKTTLLKALHKLNPASHEPFNIKDEWPRGHREKRSNVHAPCRATFELTGEEIAQLGAINPEVHIPGTIEVSRTYEGKVVFNVPTTAPVAARLEEMLPKFVFMDEYQVFDGMAYLDQVQGRRPNLLPADKALLTILNLAGLDLDSLVRQGNEPDKTERQYDLSDGGATLTKRLAGHWKQQPYVVELDADQQQFWTFVKSPGETARTKLEERSRGFRWFFSFDAKLAHETGGELKDCVILLDEPGLHLHASAQKDLLARLEEYAAGNTLIYTSHLPFMLNLREPDRIRVLSGDDKNGPQVSEKLSDATPEAKLTLQAALGMNGLVGMPADERNLLVEGVHDYWYLSALSNLFERSGKACVPPDVLITPCGGASEVTYMATFMVGQKLQVVGLYDSDPEGQSARDNFIKKWLSRYSDTKASALMLAEASGIAGEGAIEDLFPEAFYMAAVKEAYATKLPAAVVESITLKPGGALGKRVEAAFTAAGQSFSKGAVARKLAAKLRAMKSLDELPPETKERAEKLFQAITKAFA